MRFILSLIFSLALAMPTPNSGIGGLLKTSASKLEVAGGAGSSAAARIAGRTDGAIYTNNAKQSLNKAGKYLEHNGQQYAPVQMPKLEATSLSRSSASYVVLTSEELERKYRYFEFGRMYLYNPKHGPI